MAAFIITLINEYIQLSWHYFLTIEVIDQSN